MPEAERLYYDGTLAKQTAASPSLIRSPGPGLYIGAGYRGSQTFFRGLIDEVYVYDRELQAKDIRRLAGQSTSPPAAPVRLRVHGLE
ncbi:MAG: LamG domain-containing protein [Kiritimatiellae bacterium]|nr:LamG domain-containing protein [Kiritimatiellia bacterium]